MNVRLVAALAIALLGTVVFTPTAQAQAAPAPVGVWKSNSGGTLMVTRSGAQYLVNGRPLCTGSWTWDFATRTGGVLTIHYNPRFRNKLYFNITWAGRDTILCWGESFRRQ
jgi:hypothetical protein